MAQDIKHGDDYADYMSLYSLNKVTKAAFVMFGYFILNPLMILLLSKYVLWVSHIEYLWVFSIYGYSFSIFIIMMAFTVLPIDWLNWTVLCYAGFISMLFIFLEMYTLIKQRLREGVAKFLLLALWIIALHVVFILSLKLYFLA